MKVLAVDTATEACSAALLVGDRMVARFVETARGHADQILGMVDAVLREGGVGIGDLDGIAAGIGPGSFTGIRICVSVAQGLAFGAAVPVVGVTTLEALAEQARRDGGSAVLACLDARMGEVYWACFDTGGADPLARGAPAVGPARSVSVPFAGRFTGIGRGFAAHPELQSLPGLDWRPQAGAALPHAADIARLGAARLRAGGGIEAAELVPLYVRDQVALTEVERSAGPRPAVPEPPGGRR